MQIRIKEKSSMLTIGLIILIAGGVWLFQKNQNKQEILQDQIDAFEDQEPAKCENGEWIDLPAYKNSDKYEKFESITKLKETAPNKFSNEDGSINLTTDPNYSLYYFMDRDVAIEGLKLADNEVYVKSIKCVGVEANKAVQDKRQAIMKYVADNIDSIAPEKNSSPMHVQTFYFYNDSDFYLEYESEASFAEEAPYDAKIWLVRATEKKPIIKNRKKIAQEGYDLETLAYIAEDADDPEKNVLKQGEDIYKDVQNLVIYEYDESLNKWVLQ